MNAKYWSIDAARNLTDHLESRGKSLGMDEMREAIAAALRAAFNKGVEAAAQMTDDCAQRSFDEEIEVARALAEQQRALKEPTP